MSKLTKAELKKTIRTKYLEKRNQMEPEKRKEASKKIKEWLFANKHYKAAQTTAALRPQQSGRSDEEGQGKEGWLPGKQKSMGRGP